MDLGLKGEWQAEQCVFQYVHVVMPRTTEHGTLHGKGELKLQMELGLLICSIQHREVILDCPCCVSPK